MNPESKPDSFNLAIPTQAAQQLWQAVQQEDHKSAARFTWHHPNFRGKTGVEVIEQSVTLADAEYVVARENGFTDWNGLTHYAQLLHDNPAGPAALFETAVRAIIYGHVDQLQGHLAQYPQVASQRSGRQHRCVLPHYLAANGVEDENQKVPSNAMEIAEVLLDAGANTVVDATSNIYGGGAGSTPLVALVTSSHPHTAGVQPSLVHAFCDAGANVDGIENDGLPLCMAFKFRYPAAAQAFAGRGATINNLPIAAGLGCEDLILRYLSTSEELPSFPCKSPAPDSPAAPPSVAPHPPATLQQAFVFACMAGQLNVVEMLLNQGIDCDAAPPKGVPALHEACYQGHVATAKILLHHGADPNLHDPIWNSTPAEWAKAGGYSDLADWLLKYKD